MFDETLQPRQVTAIAASHISSASRIGIHYTDIHDSLSPRYRLPMTSAQSIVTIPERPVEMLGSRNAIGFTPFTREMAESIAAYGRRFGLPRGMPEFPMQAK
jgi:hypothetical protein